MLNSPKTIKHHLDIILKKHRNLKFNPIHLSKLDLLRARLNVSIQLMQILPMDII